jgi:uncharacterized Rmd1/YagE family protein
MDCLAFCTADSYQTKLLYEQLKQKYTSCLYRDVIHVEIPCAEDSIPGDLFIFPYGAIVSWGTSKQQTLQLLTSIRPFEHHPREELESDEFTYSYGAIDKVIEDEITLSEHEALSKLAVSHAIAQSVKLGTFETALLKSFNNNQYLPENLALYGEIPLSRRDIRRKMGELFLVRSSINVHLDALDAPEFFWEYPELEHLYKMMALYLDINTRLEVLNQRLDVVHELFEMLGNELNHQHSSRLEWIIIILIVIEVILTLAKDFLKLT